jgi:hypothetical protein
LPDFGRLASPIYKHIEFVRNAETLWRKIESHWGWLGVHPEEKFVVGYPKRVPGRPAPGATAIADGAEPGEHGVQIWVPLSSNPNLHWFPTEQQAEEHFRGVLSELTDDEGPMIMRGRADQGGEDRGNQARLEAQVHLSVGAAARSHKGVSLGPLAQ